MFEYFPIATCISEFCLRIILILSKSNKKKNRKYERHVPLLKGIFFLRVSYVCVDCLVTTCSRSPIIINVLNEFILYSAVTVNLLYLLGHSVFAWRISDQQIQLVMRCLRLFFVIFILCNVTWWRWRILFALEWLKRLNHGWEEQNEYIELDERRERKNGSHRYHLIMSEQWYSHTHTTHTIPHACMPRLTNTYNIVPRNMV